MPVECIHGIGILRGQQSFLVYVDGEDLGLAHVNVLVQNIHGDGIIDVIKVGFKDDSYRLGRLGLFWLLAGRCQEEQGCTECNKQMIIMSVHRFL